MSQIAAALGLERADGSDPTALAWDISAILDAWAQHLDGLETQPVTAPTPSRGRSLRNLTVNTFHPIELLPAACERGVFPWNPDGDDDRERLLIDAAAVQAYAGRIAGLWAAFVLGAAGHLEADLPVESPRGEVTVANLLASQRWHAAYHYRQLVAFLEASGRPPAGALIVEQLPGLGLPPEVF